MLMCHYLIYTLCVISIAFSQLQSSGFIVFYRVNGIAWCHVTVNWRRRKGSVDNSTNERSLLVVTGDVGCTERLNLLPVGHRGDAGRRTPPTPAESKDCDNGGCTRSPLGGAELDMDERLTVTSSLSSSTAAIDVTDCKDDAAVTPTDDVYKYVTRDVIRTHNYHVSHQPMTDKV